MPLEPTNVPELELNYFLDKLDYGFWSELVAFLGGRFIDPSSPSTTTKTSKKATAKTTEKLSNKKKMVELIELPSANAHQHQPMMGFERSDQRNFVSTAAEQAESETICELMSDNEQQSGAPTTLHETEEDGDCESIPRQHIPPQIERLAAEEPSYADNENCGEERRSLRRESKSFMPQANDGADLRSPNAEFEAGEDEEEEYWSIGALTSSSPSTLQPLIVHPDKIYTTRPPMTEELIAGLDEGPYAFVGLDEFLWLLAQGVFVDHSIFEGNYYGVPAIPSALPLFDTNNNNNYHSSSETLLAVDSHDSDGINSLPQNQQASFFCPACAEHQQQRLQHQQTLPARYSNHGENSSVERNTFSSTAPNNFLLQQQPLSAATTSASSFGGDACSTKCCLLSSFESTPMAPMNSSTTTTMTTTSHANVGVVSHAMTRPSIAGDTTTSADLGLLPPNWEVAYSPNGEKYFIDHNEGRTQWEDPRLQRFSTDSGQQQKLPDGWERITDPDHGIFYVDHANRRTQLEPPPPNPSAHNQQPIQQNGAGKNGAGYSQTQPTKQPFFRDEPAMATYIQDRLKNISLDNNNHSMDNGHYYDYHAANGKANNNGGDVWQQQNNDFFRSNGQSRPQSMLLNGSGGAGPPPSSSAGSVSHPQQVPPLNGNNNGGCWPPSQPAGFRPAPRFNFFTRNPLELRGESIHTRIQKGPTGLGVTLIGNDGNNSEPEFIQIKNILPRSPAAINGMLQSGDVIVYVNGLCLLGASQDDACRLFKEVPVGEMVDIQICRGYPLQLNGRTVLENVYAQQVPSDEGSNSGHEQRSTRRKDLVEIEICKGHEGFGFTITDDSIQGQRVKSVLYPNRCPNLLEGDVIAEVDGRNVRALPHIELVRMLQELPVNTRCKILVSRSRTPTAGFRYGFQSMPVNGRQNGGGSRSRTPAPGHRFYTSSGQQQQLPACALEQQMPNWHHETNTLPNAKAHQQYSMRSSTGWQQPLSADYNQQQQQAQFNSSNHRASLYAAASGAEYAPAPFQQRQAQQALALQAAHQARLRRPASISELGPLPPLQQQQPEPPKAPLPPPQQITVELIRQPTGFGFRLKGGGGCPLFVDEIIPGGSADRDGRLQRKDEIVAINDVAVQNALHAQAVELIQRAGETGRVLLTVLRHPIVIENSQFSEEPRVPPATGTPSGSAASSTCTSSHQQQPPYDIRLRKGSDEEFGCTIISRNHRYIGAIMPNSPAARSNQLRIGDCVIAINGITTYTMNHQQISDAIALAGDTVTFTVDPAKRMPALCTPPPASSSGGGEQQFLPPPVREVIVRELPVDCHVGGGGEPLQPLYGTVQRRRTAAEEALAKQNNGEPPHQHGMAPLLVSVELSRGPRGFGFSIRGGSDFDMAIFILRLAEDGPAATTAMRVGDELLEVNGTSTEGMSHEQVIRLVRDRQSVRLLLRRIPGRPPPAQLS